MNNREQLLRDIKTIMHKEYNHELIKFYNRRRYMKEMKKYKRKRDRLKFKKMDVQI